MLRRWSISGRVATLAVWAAAAILAHAAVPSAPSGQQSGRAGDQGLEPPSDAEIHARALKVIANQHRDDEALDEFERVERVSDRTSGASPRTLEDKTYRVVPTGSGTYRIVLKNGDRQADPTEYRRQLQQWADALELALKTSDSRTKTANEKYKKRMRERAEIVDATNEGYNRRWQGSEVVDGHLCDVVQLDPNPQFHAHSMLQEMVTHVQVKLWVDHASDQIVRGEARVLRDISFGGGVFGKLYRGGVFSLEQAEVAPGIWEPTRKQYDFSARRFLFPFEEHQLTESSLYRRLGSPRQALSAVNSELAASKAVTADP